MCTHNWSTFLHINEKTVYYFSLKSIVCNVRGRVLDTMYNRIVLMYMEMLCSRAKILSSVGVTSVLNSRHDAMASIWRHNLHVVRTHYRYCAFDCCEKRSHCEIKWREII